MRKAFLWLLAAAYLVAGLAHLAATDAFVAIVPDWVPAPRAVVLATGLAEILGAAALATRRWRRAAGLAFALYAVAVFPANIKHALDAVPAGGVELGWWYHAPRLALQPVIVWLALWVTGWVDWPFRSTPTRDR